MTTLSQTHVDSSLPAKYLTSSTSKFSSRPRSTTWLFFVLVVSTIITIFGGLYLVVKNTSPESGVGLPGVVSITEAQLCNPATSGDAPPADCRWEPVKLKRHVRPPKPIASDYDFIDGWFRASFPSAGGNDTGLGLYINELDRAGRIWVNGKLLQPIARLTGELPLNWNRAQYTVIPPSMLVDGQNELLIQVRSYRTGGTLSAMKVGPPDVLYPYWERMTFYRNDVVRVLGGCTAAIGIFMLAVWLGRRSAQEYLFFGLTCLTWSITSFDYYGRYPALPSDVWDHTVISSHVFCAALIWTFILRYCGQRRPKLEALIWVFVLSGSILFFTKVISYGAIYLWLSATWAAGWYFVYLLAREGWKRSWWEGTLLTLVTLTHHVISGHDLWRFAHASANDMLFYAHYSEPLYLLVVGISLIRAFIDSLHAYQRLTDKLENIVADKTRELAAQYQRMAELERNKALSEERGRIMDEMHDGIGSQLTIALSLARTGLPTSDKGELATVLMESIQDLQLIINSLEPMENDLLTVLGTLRYQMADRLRNAGIELRWNVVDLPPLPSLTPQSVLAILRICQEAFANALKHAGAKVIDVMTGIEVDAQGIEQAFVSIVDDGRGIGAIRAGARGLENMKRRAATLGGLVTFTSEPGRTQVLLRFPTSREVQAPGAAQGAVA